MLVILVCFVDCQLEFPDCCTATPLMQLVEKVYDLSQLDCFDLYRCPLKAGQLLAFFELLEASQGTCS